MKKVMSTFFIVTLVFLIGGYNAYAQSVAAGRAALFNNGDPTYSGLIAANDQFKNVLTSEPSNPEANLFYAITRIGVFGLEAGSSEIHETMRDVFEAFGMTLNGNDNMTAGIPYNIPADLPGNSPDGEDVQQFLDSHYMALLDGALANLEQIPNTFETTLTAAETGGLDVEIDYGDVLLYKALLNANRFLVMIMTTYDLSIDIDATVLKIYNNETSIQDELENNTNLLTFRKSGAAGAAKLRAAEAALLLAADNYLEASAFIRSETDSQVDDLISFDPEDPEDPVREERFREQLTEITSSLNENRAAELADWDHQLNLNPFFGEDSASSSYKQAALDGIGPYALRDLLPTIVINAPYCGGFDPTFGGILPDMTCITFGWPPLISLDIWDFSGDYEQSLDNATLTYTLAQDFKGKLTGSGKYETSDNSTTIDVEVKGKVKGNKGTVSVKYTVKGTNADKDKIQDKLDLTLSDDNETALDGTQKGKLCLNGEKCVKIDSLPVSLPVDPAMTGVATLLHDVEMDAKGKKLEGTAKLTLSNSDVYDLVAKGKYNSKKEETQLQIKGVEESTKGIKIKLTLDGYDNGTATAIKAKALGQKYIYELE